VYIQAFHPYNILIKMFHPSFVFISKNIKKDKYEILFTYVWMIMHFGVYLVICLDVFRCG
jgi:hypothetical protein